MAGVGQDFMGVLVVFLTKCSQRDFARHGQGGNGVFLKYLYMCAYVYLCVFFSGTVDFCMFDSGWIVLTDVVVLQRPVKPAAPPRLSIVSVSQSLVMRCSGV